MNVQSKKNIIYTPQTISIYRKGVYQHCGNCGRLRKFFFIERKTQNNYDEELDDLTTIPGYWQVGEPTIKDCMRAGASHDWRTVGYDEARKLRDKKF